MLLLFGTGIAESSSGGGGGGGKATDAAPISPAVNWRARPKKKATTKRFVQRPQPKPTPWWKAS